MTDGPELDIATLQQRIEEDPPDAQAHSSLGTALTSQARFQEAITVFEKALRLNPRDSHAELALCLLVTLVEPSDDLLKFLDGHGGPIIKMAQEDGSLPRVIERDMPEL